MDMTFNMSLEAARLLLNSELFAKKLTSNAEIITTKGVIYSGATNLIADLVEINGILNTTSLNKVNQYEEGCGVQQNYATSIEWYKKAANNGVQAAKEKLKELNKRH